MISEQDRTTIIDIARRYNASEVLLFGSSADPSREANDIDVAVKGVVPEKFFNFYGDLIFSVSKPVDLIDLSANTKFNRLVYREGIRLYGPGA